MNKLILIIPLFITTSLLAQDSFIEPIDTLNISIDSDGIYAKLDANSEYLVYYNLITNSVQTYSLSNFKQNSIKLIPGRGPNEYITISDLIIDENNLIYLVDVNGYKIIKIDTKGIYQDDIIQRNKSGIMSILKNDTSKFVSVRSDLLLGSYYHKINLANENTIQLIALNPIKYDLKKINHKNFFNFIGHADVNDYHLVHAHTYSSKFTIYPLDTLRSLKVLDYDEYEEIKDNRYINKESTRALSLPPAQVDVLLEHMFIHPNNNTKVYINAIGNTNNKSYSPDDVYEYDLIEQAFTGAYNLGYTPASICRYKDLLYILPKFDGSYTYTDTAIFVYKIK